MCSWVKLSQPQCFKGPSQQLQGYGQAADLASMMQLAKLHAAFWGRAEHVLPQVALGCNLFELIYLKPSMQHEVPRILKKFRATAHVASAQYGDIIPEFDARDGDDAVKAYFQRLVQAADGSEHDIISAQYITELKRPHQTVLHGDYHAWNLFFKQKAPGDWDVCAFDWQYTAPGLAVWDIAYYMCVSTTAESGVVLKMLQSYHESLLAANVTNYSPEQLQEDFVRAFLLMSLSYFAFWGNGQMWNTWVVPRMTLKKKQGLFDPKNPTKKMIKERGQCAGVVAILQRIVRHGPYLCHEHWSRAHMERWLGKLDDGIASVDAPPSLSKLVQAYEQFEVEPEPRVDSVADETDVPTPGPLEGKRVEIVREGLSGTCVKHLVEEGRLRIRLDDDAGRTVWRTMDCCVTLDTEQ